LALFFQTTTYDIRHTRHIGFVFSTQLPISLRENILAIADNAVNTDSVTPAQGAVAEREIAASLRSSQ
jgi:hypothetical protein